MRELDRSKGWSNRETETETATVRLTVPCTCLPFPVPLSLSLSGTSSLHTASAPSCVSLLIFPFGLHSPSVLHVFFIVQMWIDCHLSEENIQRHSDAHVKAKERQGAKERERQAPRQGFFVVPFFASSSSSHAIDRPMIGVERSASHNMQGRLLND